MPQTPSLITIAKEVSRYKKLADIKFVGSGAFKETYKTTTKDRKNVALKIWDHAKCNPVRSEREMLALKKCDTPLIGKLYEFDSFKSSKGDAYYFSLEEFLNGGTLEDKISSKSLPPSLIRNYAISIIRALNHLKNINLVHRDIKPDNIMFRKKSPNPVLVDLGLVRDLSAVSVTSSWLPRGPCTPYYAAPEQLKNEKDLIDWRTDQFSLGIVLGICLTKRHPFAKDGMKIDETIDAVAERQSCANQFCETATKQGVKAIIKMINPWPIQRYQSIDDMLNSFKTGE